MFVSSKLPKQNEYKYLNQLQTKNWIRRTMRGVISWKWEQTQDQQFKDWLIYPASIILGAGSWNISKILCSVEKDVYPWKPFNLPFFDPLCFMNVQYKWMQTKTIGPFRHSILSQCERAICGFFPYLSAIVSSIRKKASCIRVKTHYKKAHK